MDMISTFGTISQKWPLTDHIQQARPQTVRARAHARASLFLNSPFRASPVEGPFPRRLEAASVFSKSPRIFVMEMTKITGTERSGL